MCKVFGGNHLNTPYPGKFSLSQTAARLICGIHGGSAAMNRGKI